RGHPRFPVRDGPIDRATLASQTQACGSRRACGPQGTSAWETHLKSNTKLSPSMTLTEFDNGYWYATQLKEFAEAIGIPSAAKLRKDELEKAIKLYLVTGKIENPTKRSLSTAGVKDVELGLRLDLPVVLYTNHKETKDFLEREAQRFVPSMKRKSGVRYRLNRWREEQLMTGIKLTY